jgi:hypothetical protein
MKPFIASFFIIALFSATGTGGVYFPNLFQRTIYTDNLLMDGGWWANPAVITSVNAPYAFTANALPLGDSLLISSFRFFLPIKNFLTAGIEILGAGAYKTGSTVNSVDNGGATFSSSFAFGQPRLIAGAACRIPYAGSIGITGTVGYEERYSEGAASPGIGLGWISPSIAGIVEFSIAAMFIYHDLETVFWEKNCKAGFRIHLFDSLVSASSEYSFTPGNGAGIFSPDESRYEAFKTMVSAIIYERMAVMAGFSADYSTDRYRNGPCAHAGLEVLQANDFPFAGGYDIGFRPGMDWILIHHIWLGLNFRILSRMQNRRPVQ